METQKNFLQRNLGWIIPVGVVVIIALWSVAGYNSFVRSNTAIDGQWAQVETQYQRRFDLIPNVVNAVKGYDTHEQAIYDSITLARTQYAGATTPDAKAAAATQVEAGLGRLLVVAESNPQLQSAPLFQSLTVELEGTENRISVERMKYNTLVQSYNTGVQTFPSSVLAGMFGLHARTYFNAPEAAQSAPTVNFAN